jgi:hypothetical protein
VQNFFEEVAVKSFPKEFSKAWWRLWFSGAIDKKPVYFRHLADQLRARRRNDDGYYIEDPDAVRTGARLPKWTRGFLDLMAAVAGELHLSPKDYDAFATELIGQTANEADQVWQEKKS